MRFSESVGIGDPDQYDWFDPHLTIDTRLFLDPALLLHSGDHWAGCHERLVDHFLVCYRLLAKGGDPQSTSVKAARTLLKFPEPWEIGLGYTRSSTRGAGGGNGAAGLMIDGIRVALAAGLTEPEHIEEVGLFAEGIGADRISDAACNILKADLIAYTQGTCQQLGIEMQKHKVDNAQVSVDQARWFTKEVSLPTNEATGGPVILVPKSLLQELPAIDADRFLNDPTNDDLRTSLNLTVGRSAKKSHIVDLARRNPERVRAWARRQTSRKDLTHYNFADDPSGQYLWDRRPAEYAAAHPMARPPATQDELSAFVSEILNNFKHFVEQQHGWSLLWNEKGAAKREEASQLLLLGMSQRYLRDNGVEIDREVELGRGPVDFKITGGPSLRVLIEIKKTDNGKFWNGLSDQLPSYLNSDQTVEGWFVAIHFSDTRYMTKRLKDLPSITSAVAKATGQNIRHFAIDARPPLSASKLRAGRTHRASEEGSGTHAG